MDWLAVAVEMLREHSPGHDRYEERVANAYKYGQNAIGSDAPGPDTPLILKDGPKS